MSSIRDSAIIFALASNNYFISQRINVILIYYLVEAIEYPKSATAVKQPVKQPKVPFHQVIQTVDLPSKPVDQPSKPVDQPSKPVVQPSKPVVQPSKPVVQPSKPVKLSYAELKLKVQSFDYFFMNFLVLGRKMIKCFISNFSFIEKILIIL